MVQLIKPDLILSAAFLLRGVLQGLLAPLFLSWLLHPSHFTSGFITLGRANSLMDKPALAQPLRENVSGSHDECLPGSRKAEGLFLVPISRPFEAT